MIDTRTEEQKFHDEMLMKEDALRRKQEQEYLAYCAQRNGQGDRHSDEPIEPEQRFIHDEETGEEFCYDEESGKFKKVN